MYEAIPMKKQIGVEVVIHKKIKDLDTIERRTKQNKYINYKIKSGFYRV